MDLIFSNLGVMIIAYLVALFFYFIVLTIEEELRKFNIKSFNKYVIPCIALLWFAILLIGFSDSFK
jgi:Na+/H+ antiporter NhaA